MRRVRRQVGGVGARRAGRATSPPGADPALLVGLAPFDDAAIYRIDDTTALVSTTDFFPPLVDDPADYGAIAAANACSDVFAMGGRVVLAINVAAFPEHFPPAAMAAIFDGRRRPSSPRPAARSPAGTRSATRSRCSGSPCRASSTPTACSARAGPGRATSSCCRSRSAPGSTLAGGGDDDKAAAIAGMRRLNRAAVGGAPGARRRRCTPSPTSPGTASPATAGRWPSAAASGS